MSKIWADWWCELEGTNFLCPSLILTFFFNRISKFEPWTPSILERITNHSSPIKGLLNGYQANTNNYPPKASHPPQAIISNPPRLQPRPTLKMIDVLPDRRNPIKRLRLISLSAAIPESSSLGTRNCKGNFELFKRDPLKKTWESCRVPIDWRVPRGSIKKSPRLGIFLQESMRRMA